MACIHCGHAEEEHEGRFFQPCVIEDCECEDFENDDDDAGEDED